MLLQNVDDASMMKQLNLTTVDIKDSIELQRVLRQLLFYPSDRLAALHHNSNQLGQLDLPEGRTALRSAILNYSQSCQICQCCYQVQQRSLHCCTPIHKIVPLGQVTKLFFNDMKYCIVLLFVTFIFYAIYAFVTNIVTGNRNQIPCALTKTCNLALIGLGSKLFAQKSQRNNKFYIIQAYLGLAMICIWAVIFNLKMCQQRKIQIQQNKKSPTASDFSLVFKNLPKYYTMYSLQEKLNIYANTIRDHLLFPDANQYSNVVYDMGFTIKTFNPIRQYYVTLRANQKKTETSSQLQLRHSIKQLRTLILTRGQLGQFPISLQQRYALYGRIDNLKIQIGTERIQVLESIQQTFQQIQTKETRDVFITFNHTFAQINMFRLNYQSFFEKILCCKNSSYGIDIHGLKIQKAPQPEDIIWQNMGVKTGQIIIRKLITYFFSIVLLGISFGIMYGLSRVQENYQNMMISLLISFVSNIVNILLNILIQFLTSYQKDTTNSSFQISLCIKITVAQLVNSIILSMITAYYIKNNIYQEGGLVDDVFYFSLLNAFISPIIRLVNPYYIYLRIMRAYKSQPKYKLKFQSQVQFNKVWEAPQFQLGLQYVYPIKTLIYTAFFVSLQPIIVIFALIGLILMYNIQKHVLYYQSSRPRTGFNLVFSRGTNWLFYLSIIAYCLGSLTWTNFLPDSQPRYAFIPNVIAIGIGLLIYFLAVTQVGYNCMGFNYVPLLYDEQRIYFPSQYDRLNPVSKSQGLKNFFQYINWKKNEVMYKSKRKTTYLPTIQQLESDNQKDVDALLLIKKIAQQPVQKGTQIMNSVHESYRLPPIRASVHTQNLIQQCINRSKIHNSMRRRPNQSIIGPTQRNMLRTQSRLFNTGVQRQVHMNHHKLKTVMEANDCPGNQKPNMIGLKFNPIDFIQAVEDPTNGVI